MNGQQNESAAPPLCANGCGFYGSPTTKNLCSKCYREFDQRLREAEASKIWDSRRINDDGATTASRIAEDGSSGSCGVQEFCLPQSGPSSGTPPSEEIGIPCHRLPVVQGRSEAAVEPTTQQPTLTGCGSGVVSGGSVAAAEEAAQVTEVSATGVSVTDPPSSVAEVSSSANLVEDEDNKTVTKKSRCVKCNKKLGLLGFQCRCGQTFCGTHRHADLHHCPFDYRELGRQQLSKANQRVVADKLNRI